jgi:hypothetical protein
MMIGEVLLFHPGDFHMQGTSLGSILSDRQKAIFCFGTHFASGAETCQPHSNACQCLSEVQTPSTL